MRTDIYTHDVITNLWRKATELGDPVGHGGERRDDEEGPLDALLDEVRHQRDALDRLAQAHLVRQDAVDAVLVDDLRKVATPIRKTTDAVPVDDLR